MWLFYSKSSVFLSVILFATIFSCNGTLFGEIGKFLEESGVNEQIAHFSAKVQANSFGIPVVAREFEEEIRRAGYPCEIHSVISDGYLVRMIRIPYTAKTMLKTRKPVFMMHPFLESGHAYLVQGPKLSLAYLLAEAGYDVWIGNARGTDMSLQHVSLSADSPEYWQYSWQDIGEKDLRSFIDYVLRETGAPKLSYVGFSQGTTVFLVLMSLHPEYNNKIDHAHLMALVGKLKNTGSRFYKKLSEYYYFLKEACEAAGFHKITRNSLQLLTFAELLCKKNANAEESEMCDKFNWLIGFQSVRKEIRNSILKYVPAGVSLGQILHFAQLIRSGKFQQFDYDDVDLNKKKYGQETPPEFDVSKITADIYTYKSEDDTTTTIKNIEELEMELPNLKGTHVVSGLSHSDFVYNEKAADLVYSKLISDMTECDNKIKSNL